MYPNTILRSLNKYKFLNKNIYNNILKSGKWSRIYAGCFEEGRFEAGEPAILKSAHNTYYYIQELARYKRVVIPKNDDFSDWPEAGKVIMKDPGYAYLWCRDEIRGPWPEAEPYIAKDGVTSVRYALNIIKDRFELGEPAIKKLKESPDGSMDNLLYHDYTRLLRQRMYNLKELGFG